MFYVPTGTDNAIDTCDVVLAASAGAGCAVTLLDGSVVRVAATVDDFGAELNALYPPAEPFLIGPLPLGGTQTAWLAANKVQRVQPDPRAPLESFVAMLSLRSLLRVPVPVNDLVTFLNTASGGCGGGGGAGGGGSYGTSGFWVPSIENINGAATVSPNLNGGALFTRQGPFQAPPAIPQPAPGDIVQLQCEMFINLPAGTPLGFDVTNLPAPIANGFFTTTWALTRISGGNLEMEHLRFNGGVDASRFRCEQSAGILLIDAEIRLDFVTTYEVDAV